MVCMCNNISFFVMLLKAFYYNLKVDILDIELYDKK